MHIEPGLVDGTKILMSYGTAAAALAYTAKLALDMLKNEGIVALLLRSAIAAALVFSFFELLPHHPVGGSEVHLILGTTLMLVFGVAPACISLAAGLLIQGLFFEPQDIPQYGMNVTTCWCLCLPLLPWRAVSFRKSWLMLTSDTCKRSSSLSPIKAVLWSGSASGRCMAAVSVLKT